MQVRGILRVCALTLVVATITALLFQRSARPDILLISIDSLRHDHLGVSGYARDTTPNLDALARQGVLFRQAISASSWTLPAHVTLLTALPPERHGVVSPADALAPSAVSLAEVLRDAGYATAGFVSGPFLRELHGFSQGFEVYDDDIAAKDLHASHRGRTSPQLLRRFRDWLVARPASDGRPWFVFVHMWDVHYDYEPPPPWDTMFDPTYTGAVTGRNFELGPTIKRGMARRDLDHVIALYDGEIRYTDEHLGQIVGVLTGRGRLRNTLIVVTADHGEEFFEHGAKGHGKNLHDETIRIPLVMAYPGVVPAGQVIDQQVQLADIAPTILGLAGVSPPLGFARGAGSGGIDLAPSLRGYLAVPRGRRAHSALAVGAPMTSVRQEEVKYIKRNGGGAEVFDLRADPGERRNLSRKGVVPPVAEALVEADRERARSAAVGRTFREPARATAAHEQRLRGLGYIR